MPIDEIISYYGEKIAIYFYYLSFNCEKLFLMALVGLVV